MMKLPKPLADPNLKKALDVISNMELEKKPINPVTKTLIVDDSDGVDVGLKIAGFCAKNPQAEVINVVPLNYYDHELKRALIVYKEA